MKRKQIPFAVIMILISISFLHFISSGAPELHTLRLYDVFDTYCEITIEAGKNGDEILQKCSDYLHEKNDLWSPNNPSGDIGRLNAQAGLTEVELNADTLQILKASLQYTQETGGYFDVTVGALVNLWDVGGANPHVPSNEEITDAIHKTGSDFLTVDEAGGKAGLTKEGASVVLGAIAKGYATKGLIDILKKENISAALINLGGDTYSMGTQPSGQPWNIGIQDPLNSEKLIGSLNMYDTSVITSGSYQRYFEQDGIRYHHIINPYTGKPSNSGLVSVTIISGDPILADVLSTACFVIGYKESIALIHELNAMAVFVTEDNTVYYSATLQNYFEHDNTDYEYVALE